MKSEFSQVQTAVCGKATHGGRSGNVHVASCKNFLRYAEHKLETKGRKLKTGRDFLKGFDAKGKPTRGVSWEGIIPDINNKGSQEMTELAEELLRK